MREATQRWRGENLFHTGEPLSLTWRMFVTHSATQVFSADRNHPSVQAVKPELTRAARVGAFAEPTIADLLSYLEAKKLPGVGSNALAVTRVVQQMVRSGLLYDWGRTKPEQGPLGHTFWTWDLGTSHGNGGDLWMSRMFGAELLVPSFGSVTIPVVGEPSDDVPDAMGSGLVLDSTHIVTNAHVVRDMKLDTTLSHPNISRPGYPRAESNVLRVVNVFPHDRYDVAIIEVESTGHRMVSRSDSRVHDSPFLAVVPDALAALPDQRFRQPRWSDETYVFGFPRIPMARERPMVVQHGEVVNPSFQDFIGDEYFLFSATARPGNSGGPIVAADGMVLGLVSHEPHESSGTGATAVSANGGQGSSAPFYRGVPTSIVVSALDDLGFRGLINGNVSE